MMVAKVEKGKTVRICVGTSGPLSAHLIETGKASDPAKIFDLNEVVSLALVGERERIFAQGGEVRPEPDFRIYAKTYVRSVELGCARGHLLPLHRALLGADPRHTPHRHDRTISVPD